MDTKEPKKDNVFQELCKLFLLYLVDDREKEVKMQINVINQNDCLFCKMMAGTTFTFGTFYLGKLNINL